MNIKFWIVLIVLIIVVFGFDYFLKPKVNITTAQCPALAPVVEMVQIGQEWRCKEPEQYRDLLQPSGLWVNKKFDCWKLEMAVEEFCSKYPCSSNNIR